MLIAALVIEYLIVFGVPVALGWFLWKKMGTPWTLFLIGGVTWVASQVVHMPLNAGLTALFLQTWMPKPPAEWKDAFNSIVLGLTAGVCEETARYLVYRFWLKKARTWRQALMFGAGHGGIEAILLTGLLGGLTMVSMFVMRDMDLSGAGFPPEQAVQITQAVAEYWSMPLYMPLLAAAERVMAMVFHLSAATLVLQVFRRNRLWPLWAAIGLHTALNAVALYVALTWGAVASEASLAGLSLVSAGILWATWRADQKACLDGQDAG
jgi:uncharacterized membrane protein YhfC